MSRLPSSFDGDREFYEESRLTKLKRRLTEDPLVPFGCALTCWALYRASRAIRSGNHEQTNVMFRRRIYAQAFTILAMVGGSFYYQGDRDQRKSWEVGKAEIKAKEKNALWIKELEARDLEEKEFKARRQAMKEAGPPK